MSPSTQVGGVNDVWWWGVDIIIIIVVVVVLPVAEADVVLLPSRRRNLINKRSGAQLNDLSVRD